MRRADGQVHARASAKVDGHPRTGPQVTRGPHLGRDRGGAGRTRRAGAVSQRRVSATSVRTASTSATPASVAGTWPASSPTPSGTTPSRRRSTPSAGQPPGACASVGSTRCTRARTGGDVRPDSATADSVLPAVAVGGWLYDGAGSRP
jgi:hypothetical protein